MSSDGKSLRTAVLEDGRVIVIQTRRSQPRLLEVLAIFHETSRAREYVELEKRRSLGQTEAEPPAISAVSVAKPSVEASGLSERQSAVLQALRRKMDKNKLVAAKAAELANAASIPLGSLHSVLQSLEKKQFIKTVRSGSAKSPAAYQVL